MGWMRIEFLRNGMRAGYHRRDRENVTRLLRNRTPYHARPVSRRQRKIFYARLLEPARRGVRRRRVRGGGGGSTVRVTVAIAPPTMLPTTCAVDDARCVVARSEEADTSIAARATSAPARLATSTDRRTAAAVTDATPDPSPWTPETAKTAPFFSVSIRPTGTPAAADVLGRERLRLVTRAPLGLRCDMAISPRPHRR